MVGMQLLSQTPERRFDLFVCRVRADAKHLIEFVHETLPSYRTDGIFACARYGGMGLRSQAQYWPEHLDFGCAWANVNVERPLGFSSAMSVLCQESLPSRHTCWDAKGCAIRASIEYLEPLCHNV